ncbi:MAG: hypothetical protein ABTQ73_14210 [Caldilineales bacterium]
MKSKKYLVSAAIGSALLLASITVSSLPATVAHTQSYTPGAVIADSGNPTPTPTATPDPQPNAGCETSGHCGD